jgi:hypothetical protein
MLRENSPKETILFYVGSAAIGLLAAAAMIVFVQSSANAQDHPDFSGNWKLNTAASQIKDSKLASECAQLTITQKDSSIALAETGGQSVECSISGKECASKEVKVSFWFNGPKLVEMEYKGHAGHARKRRLTLADDGKSLRMEVIPITPEGAASLLAYDKAQ